MALGHSWQEGDAEALWPSGQHPPRLLGSVLTPRTVVDSRPPALQARPTGPTGGTQRHLGSSIVFKVCVFVLLVISTPGVGLTTLRASVTCSPDRASQAAQEGDI